VQRRVAAVVEDSVVCARLEGVRVRVRVRVRV
jgi:hypothetical protein